MGEGRFPDGWPRAGGTPGTGPVGAGGGPQGVERPAYPTLARPWWPGPRGMIGQMSVTTPSRTTW